MVTPDTWAGGSTLVITHTHTLACALVAWCGAVAWPRLDAGVTVALCRGYGSRNKKYGTLGLVVPCFWSRIFLVPKCPRHRFRSVGFRGCPKSRVAPGIWLECSNVGSNGSAPFLHPLVPGVGHGASCIAAQWYGQRGYMVGC